MKIAAVTGIRYDFGCRPDPLAIMESSIGILPFHQGAGERRAYRCPVSLNGTVEHLNKR